MKQVKGKLGGDHLKLKAIMEKHFISDEGMKHMEQDNYDKFIEERQKMIKQQLMSLLK